MVEEVTTGRVDGKPLLVVGLGASAGGLDALRAFFAAMPDHSDLAFVVITHQAPGRSSLMPELLGRATDMPVAQISTPTRVLPDHVYTAAPGFNLTISNGVVEPIEVTRPPSTMPVDVFFRSLARDQKERAVGIILSGTGSDGSLGLKEIKAELGMVMAQDRETAQYDGMPRSAVATELVDHVLAPQELANQLVEYAEIRRSGVAVSTTDPTSAESLGEIFELVRERTGHDFSRYKENTMRRRIERRINVHHLESLERYTRYLRNRPDEIDLLFEDLLIGVTSFFRDPRAWEALAPALGELVASKPDSYVVRAWVPGCSTGEEAYSLAMLLREAITELERPIDVQIFASDIDTSAIEIARGGRYPLGIGSDVSSERLARFFSLDMDLYRVRKEIREMVVFAPHDLIGDPPFTKLDILSCRNLLIYLDSDLQDRVIPIFHYALKPDGLLFLGTSESLGRWTKLFSAVDKETKLFRRVEVPPDTYSTDLPATLSHRPADDDRRPASRARARRSANLEQAVLRLLVDELVPPTVLLHERGDLIHVHGKTGFFLQPAEGGQSNPNIFDMAREGLLISLASALREASAEGREVVRHDVRVKTNGDEYTVDLRVRPISDPPPFKGMFLATFEGGHPSEADAGAAEEPARISDLERALLHARESHQSTIQELESANQELKSANEELQSTNEEIETSKEEMQSLNEELQTVNTELQGKVDELSHANDDMANLLNSTDIATVFLDRQLRIKRYTEQAREVIRLIPSDIGRSIGDLVSTLRYDRLIDDAREVLRTLVSKEIEVRSEHDRSYLMRILPYRTTDNVIDGLVLTFVEVTKIKTLEAEQQWLLEALRTSPASIWAQDTDLRITWACSPLFGKETDDVVGKSDHDLFERSDADRLTALKRSVLESGAPQRQRLELSMNGERRTYNLYVAPNRDSGGELTGISCVAVDVTWPQEARDGQRW